MYTHCPVSLVSIPIPVWQKTFSGQFQGCRVYPTTNGLKIVTYKMRKGCFLRPREREKELAFLFDTNCLCTLKKMPCPAKLTTYLLFTAGCCTCGFCIRSLSQLNHLWSLGFLLTYAALAVALLQQLKFFKQRKAFVWNNNDHFIHLYLCVSVLFPFILVCSRSAGAMSVYFSLSVSYK